MSLKYKILFTVELHHEYFSDDACNSFSIVPTDETKKLMSRYALLHRVMENVLIVMLKVDMVDAAVLPIPANTKLSFYLQVDDPHFVNITNLDRDPSNQIFSFSNIEQTKVDNKLYLNKLLSDYDGTKTYIVGDLVKDNTDKAYEAILPSKDSDAHNTTEIDYWQKKDFLQYVHPGDLLNKASGFYFFDGLTAASIFDIDFYSYNIATQNYDYKVQATTQLKIPGDISAINVPLEGLASGIYRVEVNGQSQKIFVVNERYANNIFGVVDIFNYLPEANDFSLFDSLNVSKEPKFVLRFPNRAVIWKYIARTTDITAVLDTGSVYTFKTTTVPKEFVSAKPIPLKETPLSSLQLTSTILSHIEPVANPSPDRLSLFTDETGLTFYCSEMYLNY